MWDLWWAKWHWDRFFLESYGFPLSISFHRCSFTRKNEKRSSSSQGCTISLKAAVRPQRLLRGPSLKKRVLSALLSNGMSFYKNICFSIIDIRDLSEFNSKAHMIKRELQQLG
jgi:hypothetical protein